MTNRSPRSLWAAIFLTGLLLAACKREEGDLGVVLQPEEDELHGHVAYISPLYTHTIKDDSLRSDELSNNMLGSYHDPVFGSVKTSFYTQVRLSTNNPTFDVPNIVVDSVVLSLVYAGNPYYGKLDPQTFSVYEVTQDLYIDTNYYTNRVTATSTTDLIDPAFAIQTPNVVKYVRFPSGDSAAPQLRLRLDNALGQRIINESGTGNLSNNDAFTAWFKGLYVTVNNPGQLPGKGAVLYLNTLHNGSRLSVYYHQVSNPDPLELVLLINERSARYTRTEYDYAGTAIEAQLADSTLGQQEFYLQAGAGLQAEMKFPSLLDLVADGPVIVNKAELIIPVQYFSLSPEVPPARVIVFGIDEEDNIYIVKDQFDGDAVFGGYYSDASKEYRFSLTRHIQDLLTGNRPNRGLRINATLAAVSVNRVVLSGMNSTGRAKPYLRIVYTKY